MSTRKFLEVRVPWKQIAPASILVFNSLVWFALIYPLFSDSVSKLALPMPETLVIYGMYYGGIALSAFIGASLFPRNRENYLLLWMLFGTAMTASLTILQNSPLIISLLISLLLGISVGTGLPSSLAYLADTTAVENRGTYGGLTWGAVGFGTLALALAVSALDSFLVFTVLAVWRAVGIILFWASLRLREKLRPSAKVSSYRSILGRREVTLYLLPWIMFSLVNFVESPILGKVFGEFQLLVGFIEFAISGVSAILAGILGDLVGRKRIVITGFVILGIEYAVLGLFSQTQASWYVYTACDGVAWGMFASIFFMTLWGDLAESGRKEKYYVLGGLPYLLAGFLPIVVKPFVEEIETTTAFSLASFFLFLAVLPLMYAPETLPEKKIRERELRDYVEKARKTKEKYA